MHVEIRTARFRCHQLKDVAIKKMAKTILELETLTINGRDDRIVYFGALKPKSVIAIN